MGEGDSETMSPESKGGSVFIAYTPDSKAVSRRIKTKTPGSNLTIKLTMIKNEEGFVL